MNRKFLQVLGSVGLIWSLAHGNVNAMNDKEEVKIQVNLINSTKLHTKAGVGGWVNYDNVNDEILEHKVSWGKASYITLNSINAPKFLSVRGLPKGYDNYYYCTPQTALSLEQFKKLVNVQETRELNGRAFNLDVTCSNLNPPPKVNQTQDGTCHCGWSLANN